MFEQKPSESATLHAWQRPVHAALQQRPSTQKPLRHSAFAVHTSLFTFPHAPAPLHAAAPVHSFAGS